MWRVRLSVLQQSTGADRFHEGLTGSPLHIHKDTQTLQTIETRPDRLRILVSVQRIPGAPAREPTGKMTDYVHDHR